MDLEGTPVDSLRIIWSYCRAVIGTSVKGERGASVVEYAFLVSLIAAFCIAAITMVGSATSASLSNTASKLP